MIMGQYYRLVNLTKKEFIDPQHLDEHGGRADELLQRGSVISQVLTLLVTSHPEKRGYGDLVMSGPLKEVLGRWVGDELIIIGDYAQDKDYFPKDGTRTSLIRQECKDGVYKNIIEIVKPALQEIETQNGPIVNKENN